MVRHTQNHLLPNKLSKKKTAHDWPVTRLRQVRRLPHRFCTCLTCLIAFHQLPHRFFGRSFIFQCIFFAFTNQEFQTFYIFRTKNSKWCIYWIINQCFKSKSTYFLHTISKYCGENCREITFLPRRFLQSAYGPESK